MRFLKIAALQSCLLLIPLSTLNAQETSVPIERSIETTHIIEPVRADGLIDYVEALSRIQREGVTPENNSVVMFRRAFGYRELSGEATAEYFSQLGMEPLPEDGNYLIGTQEYVDSLEVPVLPGPTTDEPDPRRIVLIQHGDAQIRPWTAEEFPLVARWIELNDEPLKFIVEGSQRPKYFSPLVPSQGMAMAIMLPDVQNSREAARLLCTRAMLKLGEGNVDAAWDDVLTCHRMARLTAQGPTLIDALVSFAVDSTAFQCDREIAQSGITAGQAIRFRNALSKLGYIDKITDCFDTGERFVYLDTVQRMPLDGAAMLGSLVGDDDEVDSKFPSPVLKAVLNGLVDWNVALRMGNKKYDVIAAAGRQSTRLLRQPKFEKLNTELEQMEKDAADFNLATLLGGRAVISDKFGKIMITLLISSGVTRAFEAEDRCRTRMDLADCAYALAAFKAEHNNDYPEQLEQLMPNYLPEVPVDIYTGKPLIYRRSESGYLLYSVGTNLSDDGGFTFGEGVGHDDLVVRTHDEDARIKAELQGSVIENQTPAR